MKASGQLRLTNGRRLISPPSLATRPTTSRVREALMNILAPRLRGSRWLDLCCGSGVMGCEAIERGAVAVTAVDRDARCTKICEQNLKTLSAAVQSELEIKVVRADLLSWLKKGRTSVPFDLIYFDPPYDSGLYLHVLSQLSQGPWLAANGLLICEHRSKEMPPIDSSWTVEDQRRYGSSSLVMLSPPERCHHDGIGSRQPQTDPEG